MNPRIDATNPIERAIASEGASSTPILTAVASELARRKIRGGLLLDVGCGVGNLWPVVKDQFDSYAGADVLRYQSFPKNASFHRVDADRGEVDFATGAADVVCAIETIEHLENPRAFSRELTRLVKPDGWIVISTPNQLSLLSKLTLLFRNEFNAFRIGSYPAHLTALLEVDLRRIASECGWIDISIEYTMHGRVPGTARHWPKTLARISPRLFSDNVILVGRKPIG